MINIGEVIETNDMVEKENLDVRTITLGISLLDCIDSDTYEKCILINRAIVAWSGAGRPSNKKWKLMSLRQDDSICLEE